MSQDQTINSHHIFGTTSKPQMKCSTELIDKKHVLQAYMYNIECSETVLPVRHLRTAVVMVCTYSSETGAKDELPYYHTIRPKFVCVQ